MQGAAGIFGSAILEVAIGLVFLYFILAVICSSVTELFAAVLLWRSRDLEKALEDMLGQGTLFRNVASHPLITALGHNDQGSKQNVGQNNGVPGKPAYIPAKTFSLALLDAVVNPQSSQDRVPVTIKAVNARIKGLTDPAEVRVGTALQTLIEDSRDPHALAAHIDAVKAAVGTLPAKPADQEQLRLARLALAPLATLDQIEAALPGALGFDPPLRDAALGFVKTARDDLENVTFSVDQLQTNVETWFDNAMDRMSGAYKRNVQWFVLCVGLLLTVCSGADTLRFATTLFANPTLRGELVTAASNQTQASPSVSNAVAQLSPFTLLFGYNDIPPSQPPPNAAVEQTTPALFWLEKVVGLLATTFAILLGAPFWFQMLQKLVNLRSTGPKPARSDAAPTDSGDPAPAS